jgi:hypothetical protein
MLKMVTPANTTASAPNSSAALFFIAFSPFKIVLLFH